MDTTSKISVMKGLPFWRYAVHAPGSRVSAYTCYSEREAIDVARRAAQYFPHRTFEVYRRSGRRGMSLAHRLPGAKATS